MWADFSELYYRRSGPTDRFLLLFSILPVIPGIPYDIIHSEKLNTSISRQFWYQYQYLKSLIAFVE